MKKVIKTIAKLVIALFFIFQWHIVMAQNYDAMEKFIRKHGMKGIVAHFGGCDSQCCVGRETAYFFEDGNCVRQSIDQPEDKVTYFGKWEKQDSIITIHFTVSCYGKGVGETFRDDECGLRYYLYSAVKEKIDIHETYLLNKTKEWIYNFACFPEITENTDDGYFPKKNKYRAEFQHYNFMSTDPNDEQKIYAEYYLSSLTKLELKRLRNQAYAKYGQVFKDKDLTDYFKHFSWYKPIYTNVTAYLTACDKINIELIKKYETAAL